MKKIEGCLFTINLKDNSSEIKATFFHEGEMFGHLKEGQVYIFSGGFLKWANKMDNNLNHDYEIIFNNKNVTVTHVVNAD
ncbi:hypothetical protein ABK040_012579 [Willaertia magna]